MLKKEVVVSVSFLQLRICVQFFEVSWLHPKQLVKKFTPQQRNIHVDLRVSTSGRTLLPITARGQAFLALSWLKQAVFAENQHAFQFCRKKQPA